MLAQLTELMSRARFRGQQGKTHDGQRDLYAVCGYAETLTVQHYRERYDRGGIAARLVDAKPEDTWRGGFELIEKDSDPTKLTTFEQAFEDLDKRLKIRAKMYRADVLAGFGRYAVIVLGAPGQTIEEPLEQCSPENLKYLQVYAEDEAEIIETERDDKNERYSLPKFYQLKRQVKTGTSIVSQNRRIHWTRVFHFVDTPLEDDMFGRPRLEKVWNLLDDLDKVTGGGAEAFWRRADQGLHFDIDPDVEVSDAELTKMGEQTDDYINGFKRILRTRGMKVNTLGSDVANLGPSAEAILEQISGATGIPQRVLLGSEQAKLASEQDRNNWDERIEARRNTVADPTMVRPFVDRLISLGVLPKPAHKGGYEVTWSQLRTADDGTKADIAAKWVALNKLEQGFIVVTDDEVRELLGKEPMKDKDRTALQERRTETSVGHAEAMATVNPPQPVRLPARGQAGVRSRAAEFDEDQPRDEDGRWSGSLYHGTSKEIAQKIREEGLKPLSMGMAFASPHEKTAVSYAWSKANRDDELAVVVLDSRAAKLFEVTNLNAVSRQTIPAEYVKEIRIYPMKGLPSIYDDTPLPPPSRILEEVMYVVFVVPSKARRLEAPVWKPIHDAADRFAPDVQREVIKVLKRVRQALELADGDDESSVMEKASDALKLFEPLADVLADVFLDTMAASAQSIRALYDEDQPRDDDGKWEASPLSKLKGRDIREATSNAYSDVIAAYGSTQEVDPTQVMSSQRTVNADRVQEYVDDPDRSADVAKGRTGNDLVIVQRGGKQAVIDGNHRLAAAVKAGRTIRATVVDMDRAFADAKAGQQPGEGIGLALMNAAKRKGVKGLTGLMTLAKKPSPFKFNATDPNAIAQAKAHAADLVSRVTKVTREAIRDAVEEAFEKQRTVKELAETLEDIVGDEDRAEAIARTEVMRASNAGHQAAWQQALGEGLLDDGTKQVWVTTPDDRLCPICEGMEGETAPLGGTFTVDGEEIDGPPAHPNCRCVVALEV